MLVLLSDYPWLCTMYYVLYYVLCTMYYVLCTVIDYITAALTITVLVKDGSCNGSDREVKDTVEVDKDVSRTRGDKSIWTF